MAGHDSINGVSALELTMRDVLDGLEDFASDYAFRSTPGTFEILSIEPPDGPGTGARAPAREENARAIARLLRKAA